MKRPNGLIRFVAIFLLIGLTSPTGLRASGTFERPVSIEIGHPLQSVVVGDFNRDGIPDVAVTEGVASRLAVLLGDGKGGLSKPEQYEVSMGLSGYLVSADVDRDGILDLVVTNAGRNSVGLLRGNGDGSFSKAEMIAIVENAQETAFADFNLDGIPDLAIVDNADAAVAIWLGDGTGKFTESGAFSTNSGENIRHIVSDDFNRDGKADVAVTVQNSSRVSVFLGDGRGKLSAPKEFQFSNESRPRGMTSGDFDRDGIPDLAVVLTGNYSDLWILLGNGDGEFRHHQTIKSQLTHWSVTSGDFNRDGALDLVTFSMQERATMYLGRGEGSFSAPLVFPSPGRPPDEFYNTIVAADLNRDAYPDLITIGESKSVVSILINTLGGVDPGLIPDESFYTNKNRPIQVSSIVVNPRDPKIVYAATANQGVLRSRDRGETWLPINNGIKNAIVYTLAIDPVKPKILYLGTWGGGIYKSTDGGDSWREINNGLTHTAVNNVLIDPRDTRRLYASTSMQLFTSEDAGEHWSVLGGPYILPTSNRFYRSSFLMIPSGSSTTLYLGIDPGLLRWSSQMPRVEPVEGPAKDKIVNAIGYHSPTGTLYVSAGGRLYVTPNSGKDWLDRTAEIGDIGRVISIVPHPSKSDTVYILDAFNGVLKSTDGGKTWRGMNEGIGGGSVRVLTIDPGNPNRLYAGSYAKGIFISDNGGESWRPVKSIRFQSVEEILNGIMDSEPTARSIPPPPIEFAKCNQCHGWTEPILKFFRKNHWQMSPSRRDWTLTVWRMSAGASLTPAEMGSIIKYMDTYYGLEQKK